MGEPAGRVVQLPPCEVCGRGFFFSDWPAGSMHAARSIHMRAHEREVKTQPKGTIMSDVDEAEWDGHAWTVRVGLGLFWIYGGRLYPLVDEKTAQFPPVGRPARDVLRALLTYAIDQLDEQA